ncbi:MAG: DUF5689 domain-containing protein [Porphyromonas sp.]|nr:DUF5689 domain-containing protein [Porphyromonas sp.]
MNINRLLRYTLLSLVLLFAACERKYEAPLITEPTVEEGLEPNITIAELKQRYADVPDRGSQLIDVDYVLKGVVVGNDISGNIYKQIYIEDGTSGISIGCDQNNISADYAVGQEVYVKAHGLYTVRYGGHLQLGMADTQANRIPYEIFKEKVLRSGWAKAENAMPEVVTIGQLNESYVGRLIQLNNVYFEGEGKLTYSDPINKETLNRNLYDAKGRSIILRNSGYSSFAADLMPAGHGSVVGVFSLYGTTPQLFLRSADDVFDFVPGLPNMGDDDTGNDNGSIDIGGGTEQPAPELTGEVLFPGSDFNDWALFEKSLNSYGLILVKESKTGGVDGSGAAHLVGRKDDKNGYFFTSTVPEGFDGSKAKSITFLIKGKVAGKSISVNVYNTNPEILYDDNGTMKPSGYVTYNLGDLTKSAIFKGTTKNAYDGSVSAPNWIKVTLDLTTEDGKKVVLPTKVGDSLIAFKFGKSADYDILLDEIRFE